MYRIMAVIVGIFAVCTLLMSCETKRSISDNSGDDDANSDGDGDTDGGDADVDDDDSGWDDDDNDDNDNDSNDTETDTAVCAEYQIPIVRLPPRLMILQDSSGSMIQNEDNTPSPKWDQVKAAWTSLAPQFETIIDLGIDTFPDKNKHGQRQFDQECDVDGPLIMDTGKNNAQPIIDWLNATTPNGATPLADAMTKFTDPTYAPIFLDGTANSYMVVFTDGQGNCRQNPELPADLVTVTQQLLNNQQIKSFAIGFGDTVDAAQLNAIAANGGTDFTTYFIATDQATLEDALSQIIDTMVSCVYKITHPNSDDVNLEMINFYFDEVKPENVIPQDPNCAKGEGWTWRDPPTNTIVEFCEKACKKIQDENIQVIIIQYGCNPVIVV
jgi:hypothetical protein